ncbi:hypothetical protein F511_01874 [Dorcoceras hygrometricum]|uniref:RING-CH-type domain-containing protein n=1 Tax=Dorcoceras hygrometricum TaxID=472368 RepID=A0A2Z7CVI0_9LAMI|nr:hypothetical protein F511_01874 [Dorcoceras hygrometricum]
MDPEGRAIDQIVSGDLARDESRSPTHLETVIEIGENEISDPNVRSTLSGPVSVEDAAKIEDKSSCVIDVNSRDSTGENHRVCRICHLSSKESGKTLMDLIELGCECKGELEAVHQDCGEAWFGVRGNRLCEICGETAKNIKGAGNDGFMEEWNDHRSSDIGDSSSGNNRRCLRGQPLCNFLMACLVIAFILPWFFRVNMF